MSQMGPADVFPIAFVANGTSAEFYYNGSKGALQISGDLGTDGVLTCEVSLNDVDFVADPSFGRMRSRRSQIGFPEHSI